MRTNFDFAPYRQSAVGLDQLFDTLESGSPFAPASAYPPFNIEQSDPDHYRVTLAVPGYSAEDIEIRAQQNLLIISGRKRGDDSSGYLHRGIATEPFERRFILSDFVKVTVADLKDGLLNIDLIREIPEAMKPRKINIGGA